MGIIKSEKIEENFNLNEIPEEFRPLLLGYLRKIDELSRKEREALFGVFAAKVAHDIRSPLSALKMATYKIGDENAPANQLIKNATNRINSLAEEILKGYRNMNVLEKSRNITMSGLELRGVINELILEKQKEYSGRTAVNLNYTYRIDESHNFTVRVDDFVRIISNLINNSYEAIKTDKGGQIDVGVVADKQQISVKILDNGEGMSEEVKSKFGQVNFTTKKGEMD